MRDRSIALFAKDKPGVEEVVGYLKKNFEEVAVYMGNVGDSFPKDAFEDGVDIVISYISPWIIPAKVLDSARLFAINFHPGPPDYPGIGCTNFAIYDEATEFGVTAHIMEAKVDTGKILLVDRFELLDTDSVHSLTLRCYERLPGVFYKLFDHYLRSGDLLESSERWKRVPYTRRELNELCRLTKDMDSDEIRRRVRATDYPGMPGAYIEVDGMKIAYETFERENS